ncbi:MBL fold metallo-hydrolase [Candidatus Dojkabacteria bacterium]|nr:MBL fold metallo-hydrolase [Candidatus Dojkabacteria bacterium]
MIRKIFNVSRYEFIVKLILNKYYVFILLLSLVLYFLYGIYFIDERFGIYFLNVGQGDSTLIETPDKKYMLVDGGPDDSVIDELRYSLPFWKRKIDYVFVTHTDADHLAGIIDVLKFYTVENVIYTPSKPETELVKEFNNLLAKRNINVFDLSANDSLKLGCCVTIDMVWVQNEKIGVQEANINNFSKSFILKYGNFRALLAGDLESKYEEVVATINPIEIDLLKVGHHGSKTSSSLDFLKRISPKFAIISVGKDNKYGHPNNETIDNLNLVGSKIFINYEYNRLYFKTDGDYLDYFAH